MSGKRYYYSHNDLQFKPVEVSKKGRKTRILCLLLGPLGLAVLCGFIFEHFFGAPKEKILEHRIESLKYDYAVIDKALDVSLKTLESLKVSDETVYRPVLELKNIPEAYRHPAVGGVERYRELNGFPTSAMIKSVRGRVDAVKVMVEVQKKSFVTIREEDHKRERMSDYIPAISPVLNTISKGDGIMYRKVHPVLGISRWHNGLDFKAPMGTPVYATGNGKVVVAGVNGGFGRCVYIEHGYGYRTIYAHLNDIKVTEGQNVLRGDLIGLSGNTGISSGPHLHYQVELYGHVKNPYDYFSDDILLSEDEYKNMIQSFTSNRK